jgi:hypothetical protein
MLRVWRKPQQIEAAPLTIGGSSVITNVPKVAEDEIIVPNRWIDEFSSN